MASARCSGTPATASCGAATPGTEFLRLTEALSLREQLARRLDEALRAALAWFPESAGNRTLLVGFSGGVDSTALLRLLARNRVAHPAGGPPPDGGLPSGGDPRLVAAHLDHRLRPDSGEQAAFAAEIARSLDVDFVVDARDVAARARREGRSLEEAGRLERLDFFAEAAAARNAAAVVLGHTRTDQAETVLLQLARGAGALGLAAMAPVRQDPRGFVIARPLLGVSRNELARLAAEEGWPVYPDPTNEGEEFTRNRVRRRVLPALRDHVNPRAEAALARTASLLRDDEDLLGEFTSRRFAEIATMEGNGDTAEVRVSAAALAEAHPALGRRLVREGLKRARGDLRRIGLTHVDAVLRLARAGRGGGSLDLPGAIVRLEAGQLRIFLPPGAGSKGAGRNL